jgi:periodic tryptophan protein 1
MEMADDDGDFESYGDEEDLVDLAQYPAELSDDEEEKEDFTIRNTDSVLVTATAESDHSNLEVYVYDHPTGTLYVHHEIMLASYPLCLQWIPLFEKQKANMIAVGSFIPIIEVWDLN